MKQGFIIFVVLSIGKYKYVGKNKGLLVGVVGLIEN